MCKVNDNIKYDNKCGNCNTWSIDNSKGSFNIGGYEMCMDGRERWFIYYWCVNCKKEISVSEEDEWRTIDDGDTVYFDD